MYFEVCTKHVHGMQSGIKQQFWQSGNLKMVAGRSCLICDRCLIFLADNVVFEKQCIPAMPFAHWCVQNQCANAHVSKPVQGEAHQWSAHLRGKVPAFEHNHEAKLHLDPQKVQEDVPGPFRILFRIEPVAWDAEKMDLQFQTDPTGTNDRAFQQAVWGR